MLSFIVYIVLAILILAALAYLLRKHLHLHKRIEEVHGKLNSIESSVRNISIQATYTNGRGK